MVAPVKIDDMAFSGHAELLKKELAEAYIKKAIVWVQEKKYNRSSWLCY